MKRDESVALIVLLVVGIFSLVFFLPVTYSYGIGSGPGCANGPPLNVMVNGTSSTTTCSGNLAHYQSLTYQYFGVGSYFISGTYRMKYWSAPADWIKL